MQAKFKLALLAGLVSAAVVPAAFASNDGIVEQMAKASWRQDIAQAVPASGGCFHASYPSAVWEQVPCHAMSPRSSSVPRHPQQDAFGQQQYTAGNGNDYTLNTTGHVSSATGSFPTFSGVTSEKSVGVREYGDGGILGANEYSLQMNTQFTSTSAACAGHSGCTVWQQFIYATDYETEGEGAVFMQDWLIGWGNSSCPSGFGSDGEGDCYENSNAVSLSDISPLKLGSVSVQGTAAAGGNDTTVVTYDGDAYSTSQPDSTLDIASVWQQTEFNVVGDAGGSEAEFNKTNVSVKVQIDATTGVTSAPTCEADNGTTGESNNLTLGSCTATTSGSQQQISFPETD
jgi:hypothetical protein